MISKEKKVSISCENPTFITNLKPFSEPSSFLYVAVVVSLLGALGLGLVIGFISPVLLQVVDEKDIVTKSWMGSLTTLGALLGGLLAPVTISLLGKKNALISYGLPFTIGWVSIFFDDHFNGFLLFYIGRFLTGLCCGLVCGTAPSYVNEISTKRKKGVLGSCFQLFITIGILFANIIGNLVEWHIFTLICAIPPILMSIFMYWMPESPIQILASKKLIQNNINYAREELKKLRSNDSSIDDELNEMINNQKNIDEILNESLMKKFYNVDFYKPLTYSLILMFFQQASGINAILFYANSIFKSASESINVVFAANLIALTQVISTLIESLIVDKVGRRLLLVCSGCGCTFGMGLLATYYLIKSNDPTFAVQYSALPLFSLVLFIISFSMGFAPIPWMMIPELTPANYRGFIAGSATAFNWGIAFLVTKFFEPLQFILDLHGVYYLFSALTLFGTAFLLIFLPETGGRSIDEIQKRYARGWKNSLFIAVSTNRDSKIVALENISSFNVY